MANQEYTAEAIKKFTNLEHIRYRPTGYIRTRDSAGVIHTIRENIDNSVDELTQIPNGKTEPRGGTIYLCLFKDKINHKFQILVKDDGRGIPSSRLVSAMTEVGTSGKTNLNSAYVATGGQFGVGAKVATALSTRYRALSKNYLENVVAEVSLADGKILTKDKTRMNYPSGLTVVFELDVAQFFPDAMDFMETGSIDIIKMCKQLNMFNDCINFQVYIYERAIDNKFWTAPIAEALGIIDDFLLHKKKDIVYDSNSVNDKTSFLFDEYWRTNSTPFFSDTFFKRNLDIKEDLREFTIKLFFTKKSATGNIQCFAAINNVVLKSKTDNSISLVVIDALRKRLANYQETDAYRKFVLEEYRLPTALIAMDVRYNGAELAGLTKDDYHDATFESVFSKQLNELLDQRGNEYWLQLATALKADIELRYAQFYDAPIKKSDNRRTFLELNFVNNFKECENYDDRSELYLVEGNSAGGIINSRDSTFQAIYLTRGKPTNGASYYGNLAADRQVLLKDPLYQDLIKIIGVTPNTTDISKAKIKKIIIATDADPDGYHIAALHLNNFSIINPLIVTSGMVWIAKPPLYSLTINSRSNIFLRDKAALYDKRISLLYSRNLNIKLKTSDGKIKELDAVTYRETCHLIHYLGEVFSRIATQLHIPLLILERLIYAIHYIYPTVDYINLARCFESADAPGYARVTNEGKFLIVSIGRDDYVIGLQDLGRMIAESVLHLVNKFRYNELFFSVRPRKVDGTWGDEITMSGMMLYTVMTQLDEKLNIERFKGLGQMDEKPCYTTIMNPATRAIVQVKSLGDLQTNYSIIGTSDSEPRKQLLSDSVVLSNTFAKEQFITKFEDD